MLLPGFIEQGVEVLRAANACESAWILEEFLTLGKHKKQARQSASLARIMGWCCDKPMSNETKPTDCRTMANCGLEKSWEGFWRTWAGRETECIVDSDHQ